MENAEEVMQILERFSRLKQKEIPKELDDYLQYVAKTGDTVFKWTNLKHLFREKLLNVITHFHETTPRMDEIPQYPNVDPFNYESMKSSLLERLESFNAAPFTVQRLCELLIDPRKQYNRIDKFMRALEKNILVSTVEPGRKRTESENGDSLDSVVNGDLSLDVNVDIDMENEPIFTMEAQNGNVTPSTAAASPLPVVVESAKEPENGKLTAEEEKDSSIDVMNSHEAPTRTEEDEQPPSPKKAKLDENVESESIAKEEVETTNNKKSAEEEVTKKEENVTDKFENSLEVTKEKNENLAEVSSSKKAEEPKGIETMDEAKPISVVEKEEIKKVEEEEKLERTLENTQTPTPLAEKNVEKNVAKDNEADEKIAAEPGTTPLDKVDSKDKDESKGVNSTGPNEEQIIDNKVSEETIIEKQETEKGEKEELPSTTKKTVDNSVKMENGSEEIKEKCDEDKTEIKEAIKNTTTLEEKVLTETKDVPVNEEEKTKTVVKVKDSSITQTDSTTKVIPTAQQELATEIENEADKLVSSSTETTVGKAIAIDKEKENEVVASSTDDTKSESIKETSIEESIATEASTTNEIESSKTSTSATTPVETSVVTPSSAPPAAIIVEEIPAAKTESEHASSPVVLPIAETPTILAASDQPMEEDPTVDEIVMAESTTPTAIAAAAATTTIETEAMEATISAEIPKADEGGDGMEVDDTSQQEEAMDQ